MALLACTKLLVLVALYQLALPSSCRANQLDNLKKLIESRKSRNPPYSKPWNLEKASGVYVGPQEGLMEADKITALPGQPDEVDFDQYAGYVTVNPKAGRALFYYFVESPRNSSTKPLVLWLNGGPGCSSLGYGAMEELGPFRVHSDGKTLYRNDYAWNDVANVIFLESPAGVGFSYSNMSSDYTKTGDSSTADDSYTFLVNWLDRFPHYKTRDFYITGESYAGHYVPQLAYTIVSMNKKPNQTHINLKGIAIGNALVDDNTSLRGMYEFFWTHALNSDETHEGIMKYCDFVAGNFSIACEEYTNRGDQEHGNIDIYNIYAPLCNPSRPKFSSSASVSDHFQAFIDVTQHKNVWGRDSKLDQMNPSNQNIWKQVEYGLVNAADLEVHDFDPCSDNYVDSYLNRPEVQLALHAKPTQWSACTGFAWTDSPTTILPTIQQLIASGIRIWVYSGDIDGRVPVTSSRFSINALDLPVETAWRSWHSNGEIGGYVVGYKGVILITVRGAGHTVPSYEPERALTLISAFLQGQLPPIS